MAGRFLNLTIVFVLYCTAIAVPSLASPDTHVLSYESESGGMQEAEGLQPVALDIAGVRKITGLDPNLTGQGVSIGIVCRSDTYINLDPQNDYRPDVSHNSLKDIKIRFHDDQDAQKAGISSHSTAIASILTGFDTDGFFESVGNFSYHGACPDTYLDIYEFRHFLVKYVFSGLWPQADLLTMSLGWSFENWWTRGIDKMAENFGLLVIAAIGNGTNAHDLPLYPAAGSNVLAVGVADSSGSLSEFSVPDANHSTAGPTLDGRCKPDIIAPGNYLIAVAGEKDAYKLSGDYSSFAVPAVAGAACLLIQKAKNDPDLQIAVFPFVGNCIMKSILMTGARKLAGWHKGAPQNGDDSEYPLDFRQGAGMVDGLAAYNVLTAGMQRGGNVKTAGWDTNIIEPNYIDEKIYRIKADGLAKPHISATLVWNRSYSDIYPFEPLLKYWADLRLELWAVDAAGNNQLVDYSNSPVDNVEHIYFAIEPNTEYRLVVSQSPNSDLPDCFTSYAISWQVR